MKLLTLGNTKTVKGEKKGYMTFIMHLAPAKLSGFNTCPMASEGCKAACLNTAGRGKFDATQEARIRKTQWFFNDRASFMTQLVKDIKSAIAKATREGFVPVIRLNGTSDIRWEEMAFTYVENVKSPVIDYANIMAAFPNTQFYDYTKLINRENVPANYHLTFSRSESNGALMVYALMKGMNIAVVFNVKKGAALPAKFAYDDMHEIPVVDGDEDDLTFLHGTGVCLGLRNKGQAKKDESGFVVNV